MADSANHAVRCIAPDLSVTTIAGGSGAGLADGHGCLARLHTPSALCHDGLGGFFVSDVGNRRVRYFRADVRERIPLPPSDLAAALAGLVDDPARADAEFVVAGGQRVYAVAGVVAARSASLGRLLAQSGGGGPEAGREGPAWERSSATGGGGPRAPAGGRGGRVSVSLPDVSLAAMRAVLLYVHSDRLELPGGEGGAAAALEVLMLAERYGLDRLRQLCGQAIVDGLAPGTACAVLEAADQAGAGDVRRACLAFVMRNLAAVRRTPGFAALSQPLLLDIALQFPLL